SGFAHRPPSPQHTSTIFCAHDAGVAGLLTWPPSSQHTSTIFCAHDAGVAGLLTWPPSSQHTSTTFCAHDAGMAVVADVASEPQAEAHKHHLLRRDDAGVAGLLTWLSKSSAAHKHHLCAHDGMAGLLTGLSDQEHTSISSSAHT
ncbi:hypothetical protein CYMTET_35892, partial [Cymbomonas tetramitiformis]